MACKGQLFHRGKRGGPIEQGVGNTDHADVAQVNRQLQLFARLAFDAKPCTNRYGKLCYQRRVAIASLCAQFDRLRERT